MFPKGLVIVGLLTINLRSDWKLANPAAVLAYKHPDIHDHEGPCYCQTPLMGGYATA